MKLGTRLYWGFISVLDPTSTGRSHISSLMIQAAEQGQRKMDAYVCCRCKLLLTFCKTVYLYHNYSQFYSIYFKCSFKDFKSNCGSSWNCLLWQIMELDNTFSLRKHYLDLTLRFTVQITCICVICYIQHKSKILCK